MRERRWTRSLIIGGAVVFLLGLVDPLEGFPFVLLGLMGLYLGQRRAGGRHARALGWEFTGAVAGAIAMIIITIAGGIEGNVGVSPWALLFVLPYPLALLAGIVTTLRVFLDMRRDELAAEKTAERTQSSAE